MKGLKSYSFANFNCTFGDLNEPMLNYFDSVIYPALQKDKDLKTTRKKYYIIKDLEIIDYEGQYALKGLFIKKTELEIFSDMVDDKLVEKDIRMSVAPYSLFILMLTNHRLILVKNQNGSPSISNFETHIKKIISKYIEVENRERTKLKEKENQDISLLPNMNLNIVSFPSKESLEKQLSNLKKIKKVALKVYPLNGEVLVNDVFMNLRKELDILKSSSGNFDINSPKDIKEVINLVEGTKGTVKATITGINKDDKDTTIVDEYYKEEHDVLLPEHQSNEDNVKEVIRDALNKKVEMREISDENKSIYLRSLEKLKRMISLF